MRKPPAVEIATAAYYYFYYAALSSLAPFLGIHYRGLGLAESRIGLLLAVSPVVMVVGASFWAFIGDWLKAHLRVLRVATVGMMASVALLAFAGTYSLLFAATFLMAFFGAPLIPIADAAAMDSLGERRDQYGRLRLWGAVGWGIGGPVAGWVAGRFGVRAVFGLYEVAMLVCLVVSSRLSFGGSAVRRVRLAGVGRLLADRRWQLFLGIVLVAGAGLGAIHSFLFLYMDDLGATKFLMGVGLLVATLGELAVFAAAPRLLSFGGVRLLMTLSLAATTIRVAAYAVTRNPVLVLPVQLLHGPSFSAMQAAGVSHAQSLAPRGLEATAQALFSATFMGLGAAAAALGGGWVYQKAGSHTLYGWTAVLMASALVFVIIRGGRLKADTSPWYRGLG
jgi:MFS family permease